MERCVEQELWTHPAEPSLAVTRIDARVCRVAATSLRLLYVATGRIGDVIIPASAPPLRTDNLWKTTCFEAFLKPEEETGYREFNFSPSGQWAAYEFDSHRTGMTRAGLPAPPEIELILAPNRLELRVALSIDLPREPYRLGLSAVIDERIGIKSLWALSHKGSVPDFHRADCFTLELPPPPAP